MSEHILETRGLTKRFQGFTAVGGVDLRITRGTIHALIGPNGAGKSTVFNLITKFIEPSSGVIKYKGVDITAARPEDIALKGIVRSFQISAVFPHLTVLENVRIALQRPLGNWFKFWQSEKTLESLHGQAEELVGAVGLAEFSQNLAGSLSYGRKRALEIATTLALEPDLMLLDEPTAGMSLEDVARIAALIKTVARNRTVLMVEHNLSVVAKLCDKITVLSRGSILAEGKYEDVARNAEVRAAYLGSGHA